MKQLLLSAALFICIHSVAQNINPERAAVVSELKKAFSKVKPGKYADLVPFAGNGKWGYIDRVTKKVMVEPLFMTPYFFHPDINVYYKGADIIINGNGGISLVPEVQQEMMDVNVPPGETDFKVRRASNGFKGFGAYPNGDLAWYSDDYQYNTQGIPGWNIQVVSYQGRFVAAVKNLQGRAGIIEKDGTPVKGFGFNFEDIQPNRGCQDSANAWFFVQKNANGNYSLMNIRGDVKCENEIYMYPLLSSDLFDYTPYIKGDTSGIFDRYTMRWVVKPQTKLRIFDMAFASKGQVQKWEGRNREQVIIYYHVQEGKLDYYTDLTGNKYLPKK